MDKYHWTVSCGDKTAEVVAVDKLRAVQQAAMQWSLPWTNIARACVCERGARAAETTDASAEIKRATNGRPYKGTGEKKPEAKKGRKKNVRKESEAQQA